MRRIDSRLLEIGTESEHILLLRSVARVEMPSRQLPAQGHRIFIIIQQDKTGGRTVTGWPSSVMWVNGTEPQLALGPDQTTILMAVTVDGGQHWIIESQSVGVQSGGGGGGAGLPEGTASNQLLIYNQTGGSEGWQPTLLKPGSLNVGAPGSNTGAFVYLNTDGTNFVSSRLVVLDSPSFLGLSPIASTQGFSISGYTNISVSTNDASTSEIALYCPAAGGSTAAIITLTNDPASVYVQSDLFLLSSTGGIFGAGLSADQANSLALRNGTTSQMFAVYNTSSSNNANYRRIRSFWSSTTLSAIAAEAAGSLASSNVSIAICPLGTGAFQLSTTGDIRGIYSVDLQTHRSLVTQVAAGAYSAILNGRNNRTAGQYSFAVGSFGATVTGNFSGIMGNQQNPQLSGIHTVVVNNHTSANISAEYSTIINNNFTSPNHRYSTVLCAPYDSTGFDYGFGLINLQHKYIARMRCTGLLRIPEETDVLAVPFSFTTGITIVPQAVFITLYLQFSVLQVTDLSDPENPVIEEGTWSQIRTYIGTYNLDGSVTFGTAASIQGHSGPTTYFDVTFASSTNSSPITGSNGRRVLTLTGNIIDPAFIGTINCQAVLEAVYSPG